MQLFKNNKIMAFGKAVAIIFACVTLCSCTALKGKGYSSMGAHYFGAKDYGKAVEYFEKAVDEEVDNAGYLGMLGWAYFKAGNYDVAISTFERLSRVDPEAVDAYTGRGWSNFKKLSFDEGIRYFEEAIEVDPAVADSYEGIGWCSFRKGDLVKAEEYFNIALRKGMKYREGSHLKTSPEAHRGLGYMKFSQGDYKTALKHFRIATRHMPAWNDARTKWGECLFLLGKYKEAAGVFKYSLNHGKSAMVYDKLGWSYLNLEDNSTLFGVKNRRDKIARKMFNKALELDPNYASSLSGLAKIDAEM